MAIAKPVALCPKCHYELPSPIPAVCPEPTCRHIIEAPTNEVFGSPDYVAYQLDDKMDPFLNPLRTKPMTPADFEAQAAVETAHRKWGKDAPIGDRIAALRDAHILLSWMLHSNLDEAGTPEVMSGISKLARQVGELGKALDLYFVNGGASGVTTVRPLQTRRTDTDRSEETSS